MTNVGGTCCFGWGIVLYGIVVIRAQNKFNTVAGHADH